MHLLLLRSLFREIISDLAGSAPTADEPNRGGMTRYLIVVARTEPAVYEHLRNRHSGDPKVRVMLDRRGASDVDLMEVLPAERRRRRSSLMTGASHELVAVSPEHTAEPPAPHPQPLDFHAEAPRQMSQIETVDDAQRTTRWLAESQYQLSHVIPSLVDPKTYPAPPVLFTIKDFGGWTAVTPKFFDPSTGLVTKIEQSNGVSTASG